MEYLEVLPENVHQKIINFAYTNSNNSYDCQIIQNNDHKYLFKFYKKKFPKTPNEFIIFMKDYQNKNYKLSILAKPIKTANEFSVEIRKIIQYSEFVYLIDGFMCSYEFHDDRIKISYPTTNHCIFMFDIENQMIHFANNSNLYADNVANLTASGSRNFQNIIKRFFICHQCEEKGGKIQLWNCLSCKKKMPPTHDSCIPICFDLKNKSDSNSKLLYPYEEDCKLCYYYSPNRKRLYTCDCRNCRNHKVCQDCQEKCDICNVMCCKLHLEQCSRCKRKKCIKDKDLECCYSDFDLLPDFFITKIILNIWDASSIQRFCMLNKKIYGLVQKNNQKTKNHIKKIIKIDKIIRRTNLEFLFPEESYLFADLNLGLLNENELGPVSDFPGKKAFLNLGKDLSDLNLPYEPNAKIEVLYDFQKKTNNYQIEIIPVTYDCPVTDDCPIIFYWDKSQFSKYLYRALDNQDIKFWNVNEEIMKI